MLGAGHIAQSSHIHSVLLFKHFTSSHLTKLWASSFVFYVGVYRIFVSFFIFVLWSHEDRFAQLDSTTFFCSFSSFASIFVLAFVISFYIYISYTFCTIWSDKCRKHAVNCCVKWYNPNGSIQANLTQIRYNTYKEKANNTTKLHSSHFRSTILNAKRIAIHWVAMLRSRK